MRRPCMFQSMCPKILFHSQWVNLGNYQTELFLLKWMMGFQSLKELDGMCVDRAGNVYCAGPKDI